MCFNVMTGPNVTQQTPRGERAMALHPAVGSSIAVLDSFIGEDDPASELVANQPCCRANVGKIEVESFGSKESEVAGHDVPCASSKTHVLQCVGLCKCKSCHQANASLHTVVKNDMVVSVMPMVIVRINESVKDAQH